MQYSICGDTKMNNTIKNRIEKKIADLEKLKHHEIDKIANQYTSGLITSNELMKEMLHLADLFQITGE